jgi:hypothetical protein
MKEVLAMTGFAFFALGMVALARAVYVERTVDPFEDWDDVAAINEIVLSLLAGGLLIVTAGPFFAAALLAA